MNRRGIVAYNPGMGLTLSISPHGRAFVEEAEEGAVSLPEAAAGRIRGAFGANPSAGFLHLATVELKTALPPSLAFARDFAQRYLTRLCHTPGLEQATQFERVTEPSPDELAAVATGAPPTKGLEYLSSDVLARWWRELDEHVREEIRAFPGGAGPYLREKNPLWRLVGRVTFHLAENKRDDAHPFAFLATYAHRLSAQASVQHLPLSRALQECAGAQNRAVLLSLLTPIQRAAEKATWIAELVEKGGIYQPLAWTPRQAYQFLQDVPVMEESGLVVRVPNWWRQNRPARPQVSVKIGDRAKSKLGVDAILDFSVNLTLEGQAVSQEELSELLGATGNLVRIRGQWVEVDREKLAIALEHWKTVEQQSREGISFFEGMRLLSGVNLASGEAEPGVEAVREWTGIQPGGWLSKTLDELRDPARLASLAPRDLKADLRPYQQGGLSWMGFMTRLGLGACLADDMGLGKTVQVLALLLHRRATSKPDRPSLLVVPASLIANWKAEIARFAPSLAAFVAHPSEAGIDLQDEAALASAIAGKHLVITTYGMLARTETLRKRMWDLVILDEAQAIKNSGTRQARAVKEAQGAGRLALTGTPVENRLSDLWSLFDFLNPGLLGSAKAFSHFVKTAERTEHNPYGPLRALVRPYILRRLKTDKEIIADLPDKTEVKAYCGLTRTQAALYEQSVRELAEQVRNADGIRRRGVVLAFLLRFKQICNHPSQWLGDDDYDPDQSGKFQRLAEICEELAERQEKALIFTQFREITAPLAEFLGKAFGRPGLVLHGGTPVAQRPHMVETFQGDDGPPFFVLSIKAGGTGLNLTAASQVIHFDRWWNPAVENQATDRAFRIGQKRNVLVHKFVCRGTVEEKVDQMIGEKVGLSQDLLDEGAERMLTEMNDQELLSFVSLDVTKAVATSNG